MGSSSDYRADAATAIYNALGIPRGANWYDIAGRPYHIYQADPIRGLTA